MCGVAKFNPVESVVGYRVAGEERGICRCEEMGLEGWEERRVSEREEDNASFIVQVFGRLTCGGRERVDGYSRWDGLDREIDAPSIISRAVCE